MRVYAIETVRSPRASGWHRLRAQVAYDRADCPVEEYWLDVPEEHASALVCTGDPWLPWLAPVAITLRESLQVDAPVDPTLLAGTRSAISTWTTWFPHLHSSEVLAREHIAHGDNRSSRVASFFSGGVDSFFTALRHGASSASATRVDSLIFVSGFDIPLSSERAWNTALSGNRQVAAALGMSLIPVATNLRDTQFAKTNWTRLSHGPALTGVAQALGGAFQTVLIPSSASYRDLRPWGSHPETDVLFTSERVRIVHDGAESRRAEKTEYIAQSELALRHLRICYHSADGRNCGTCKRCYRTMLALEALGALDRCTAFEPGALDLRKAAQLYCDDEPDMKQFGFVRDLALERDKLEIVRAIDRSFERSSRMVRIIRFLRRLRDLPVLWRWAPGWERWLLRGWVV